MYQWYDARYQICPFYVDDSCLIRQQEDVNEIEKQMNEDFENICDWFADDKLSIHFGRDKTKSIRFATKFEIFKGRKNVIMGI